ncbi:MAG: hypothetical protein WC827_00290 [Candidatus Paceibacterota bacterium]|jgi:hypothetical protein
MELSKERMGKIAILMLKKIYERHQSKMGILGHINAVEFVEDISADCADLPKEDDIKLEEYFAVMSKILPKESQGTYDEAVKNFLEKKLVATKSPEPESKS